MFKYTIPAKKTHANMLRNQMEVSQLLIWMQIKNILVFVLKRYFLRTEVTEGNSEKKIDIYSSI